MTLRIWLLMLDVLDVSCNLRHLFIPTSLSLLGIRTRNIPFPMKPLLCCSSQKSVRHRSRNTKVTVVISYIIVMILSLWIRRLRKYWYYGLYHAGTATQGYVLVRSAFVIVQRDQEIVIQHPNTSLILILRGVRVRVCHCRRFIAPGGHGIFHFGGPHRNRIGKVHENVAHLI